jgi:hypothetical protein
MEPVRTGLRHIMQDLLRTRPAEEAVILAWPLVCGKEVASRTQAVTFADGVLTVAVSDGSWRNQLQSFAPRYLSAYEELLGKAVKNVKFVVQGSVAALRHSGKPVSAESVKKDGSPKKRRQTG